MRLRVLIVDDCADVRLSLLLMLEASGFDVHEAVDGAQALELITERQVDVILVDLSLPRFKGYDLIRAARARRHRPPRIIAVAGEITDPVEALELARQMGAEAVLTKPFTRRDLLRQITSLAMVGHPVSFRA
jgi:CheY-like chemotaxis protein